MLFLSILPYNKDTSISRFKKRKGNFIVTLTTHAATRVEMFAQCSRFQGPFYGYIPR